MPRSSSMSGVPRMRARPDDASACLFLNRNQIVLVSRETDGVEITTVLGLKILIAGRAEQLAKFSEELINSIDSNFVSVPSAIVLRIVGALEVR